MIDDRTGQRYRSETKPAYRDNYIVIEDLLKVAENFHSGFCHR